MGGPCGSFDELRSVPISGRCFRSWQTHRLIQGLGLAPPLGGSSNCNRVGSQQGKGYPVAQPWLYVTPVCLGCNGSERIFLFKYFVGWGIGLVNLGVTLWLDRKHRRRDR
jgi:hypothetical protein